MGHPGVKDETGFTEEHCTRCGRVCPDGRQLGLCFKCGGPNKPKIVDADVARKQLEKDKADIRKQNKGK